ncbi:uncharacterized protein N7515_010043 [Penicillium bovifimosum]|uniref:Uncharacterized protein n=1 Tax=Penicillium bovifimosum TaxID=126998 RepID=A0A9W9GI58_9EURO|nr:uncharacterized protein N7515_010043 [Penicillium bovifimosum]KAJ5120655.1 hypothetical protein N7515_010043 [Penicillium bovifimosum]
MLSGKDNAQVDQNADREELSNGHIRCSLCSSTFRRPEHLKRHLRSHTKEKPFECAQCGRHFSRTDTLHRHELSHHAPGSEGGKGRTHRITVKTFRACFSCATARVRCSGGVPCGRCDARSLECQYPTQRRSKAKAMQEAEAQDDNLNPLHHDSKKPSHQNKFSIGNPGGVEPSSKTSLKVASTTGSGHNQQSPQDAPFIADASNPRLYLTNETQGLSAAAQLPPDAYPGDISQACDNSKSNASGEFSVDSSNNLDPELRNPKPGLANSASDLAIPMATNPEMSLEFDPAFFDQSMLSTVNWLPGELLSGTSSSQAPRSISVPSQYNQSFSPGTYFSRPVWQPSAISAGPTSPLHPGIASRTPSLHVSRGNDIESPGQPARAGSEPSPYDESVGSAKRSADYYVDGARSRLPKYRKRLAHWSPSSVDPVDVDRQLFAEDLDRCFNFPGIHEIRTNQISEGAARFPRRIEASTYDKIHRQFIHLCCKPNPFFETFKSEKFPTVHECNQFIVFFFDSFQPVYPVLHLPTFDPNTCHWLLALSIIALGCHVSAISDMEQCTVAFHEFIRRGIYAEVRILFTPVTVVPFQLTIFRPQKANKQPGDASIELMQAMLFNCIGLLHGKSEEGRTSGLSAFGDLVGLLKTSRLLAPLRPNFNGPSPKEAWMSWIRDEVRRRTGYCIWLVDCTLAYSFDDRPLLVLDDGQAALPAHEKLWQAPSAEAWLPLWEESSGSFFVTKKSQQALTLTVNESLLDAVHILYIEKSVVPGIGEFSHILLIHALYHRMWEVGDYFRRPLSSWTPTAKKQSRETAIPTGSVWLPGIPSYSKWRNSACDCLDILHWTANSTVAKAAGLEHPTVLHLHAARLFLLTPFREIRSLATALATENLSWSKRHQSLEWQYIWRWMKHDQYKARLSIVHAGVTLWHIRRYSTNAFHEPVAAFIAILTLWAYGSCHALTSHESDPHAQARSEPLREPRFVHLDRPCDDELVQLFVREGHSMRGNITGVGDICGPEGPEGVLRVGCEILSGLTAWSISKKSVAILTRLAHLSSHHSSAQQGHRHDAEHV